MKCECLELENCHLKTEHMQTILAPNKEQSEDCQKCKDLGKTCNALETEIGHLHNKVSSLNLQLGSPRYPEEFDDKCKQLKKENQILNQQIARCHKIQTDSATKSETLQTKCNYLETENNQLIVELSSKIERINPSSSNQMEPGLSNKFQELTETNAQLGLDMKLFGEKLMEHATPKVIIESDESKDVIRSQESKDVTAIQESEGIKGRQVSKEVTGRQKSEDVSGEVAKDFTKTKERCKI